MLDFFDIQEEYLPRKKIILVSAHFKVCNTKDLMIRGKSFYAIWNQESGMWSTDEYDVVTLVDNELIKYACEKEKRNDSLLDVKYVIKSLRDFSTNAWVEFKNYISKCPDNYKELDTKITFANTIVEKKSHVSKRLPYALEAGSTEAYDRMMEVLYSPEEREKIEWAIGAIISGDSKKIQKFLVFYGDPGTGKSTVLELIQKLFEGYYSIFEAKSLTSGSNAFSTEQFKNNPLVAIQHDGDLSKIEDNSKLNSIVSHEEIMINEKYKSGYYIRTNCFLLMATNKPVKITDGKAGLIRRLIDVSPTGNRLKIREYNHIVSQLDFELGAIAQHCLDVYMELGPSYYNGYKPVDMMYKTDPFFNFVEDNYEVFSKEYYVTLKMAYELYKQYCSDTNAGYTMQMYKFREELKNYFTDYQDRASVLINDNVVYLRKVYSGFIREKFNIIPVKPNNNELKEPTLNSWIDLKDNIKSIFDKECAELPAQYTNDKGTPRIKWSEVTTKLSDLDTRELHYVAELPINHIVIDFDIKDEEGNKCLEKNIEAATKFPKTYAETSQSGGGLHLHYIYTGNPEDLLSVYDKDIEIKVFTGKMSLRRKLVKCNNLPISEISSGLPLKEKGAKKELLNPEIFKNEKSLRNGIIKALNKEVHEAGTKPNVDFINHILEQAYNDGYSYNVEDMRSAIFAFAAGSSHQSEYCMKLVTNMKFKSKDFEEQGHADDQLYSNENEEAPIVFYDIEVFPNLFLVNYKIQGTDSVVRMINPTPVEIEQLTHYRLVGFNCRRYDNHLIHARMMGYSNEQIYHRSQMIINNEPGAYFGQAWNLSYTDILDYTVKKQKLKKWEIDLGIHHQELGLPWDQPVPEELWYKVAEYCDNDVIATEAVWNATQGDFLARKILAEIAGGTVNDTTNTLTTKLIFGKDKTPQNEFCYRNLAEPIYELESDQIKFYEEFFPDMIKDTHGPKKSLLPYFEGYEYKNGKSTYRGEEVGEGGFVKSKPGMYKNVVTFDVASQHPHSATSEYLFGRYTRVFNDLMSVRIFIKHKDFESAKKLFDGKLAPYLEDTSQAKSLAQALKIAINSVYGLTAAKFDNAFRDNRNIDNIVAKRGALFMIDLYNAVTERGGEVIHIKTDSIKVVNPDEEMTNYILNFGKKYGYDFEVEHKFEKICLVNDAVYIAKCAEDDPDEPGEWTATGAQFAVPYIFKTLFTKEPVEFGDLCETKTVTSSALYLDMNEKLEDVTMYEKIAELRRKLDKNSEAKITIKEKDLLSEYEYMTDEQLKYYISKGHDYQFVGAVGLFCPIKSGYNGGELVREKDGKYSAAAGTSGYRWLESEYVEQANMQDCIDMSYYDDLADKALKSLESYLDDSDFTSIEDFLS